MMFSEQALDPPLVNPFAQPGQWYKGCLHVHTTRSDGKWTPEQVIDWYRRHGYHFLAFTDHGVLSETRTVADDFVLLSGIEADGVDPHMGVYHLVGLGLDEPPAMDLVGANIPIQEAINRLRAAGGLVSLPHPYWLGQLSKDLIALRGCFGIEIYNGGSEIDEAKGLSVVHWDDMLAANRRIGGLAVDDAHWHNGTRQAGLGWVWVKAPALEQRAILQSLEQGCYYSSCGPEIHELRLERGGKEVHARCSPSVAVDFVGNEWQSQRRWAPPGETLSEASQRLNGRQRYVRVACQDSLGRRAWSNPLFLGEQTAP
jgi:hypothetical protein